mmetsp:Transcript_5527/g.9416  ORF Transcript_5527/g.9416 Transcript_5527/m.9416 type:complete len:369 (-) Transcript_5527:2298-3404(-)
MNRDFAVVGSDSGRIVVLEFDPKLNQFVKLIQETFGKTGCRRIVPGEYLVTDPKGRVLLIGAVERQKFVYQMNRDSSTNKLMISSPLEAHKPNTLTLDIVALDNGLENPQFAALEINYGDEDIKSSAVVTGDSQKQLVIYEVDLGLNHVIRKFAETVPKSSHHLIPVPVGPNDEGPGGLLVACEGHLIYKKQDHEERVQEIPKRVDMGSDVGLHIINSSGLFNENFGVIIFIQSEFGDLYKVTLDQVGQDVLGINVSYFDTIAPSTRMNLLESGYLFAAGDCSNHFMYRLTSLGDEDSPSEFVPRSESVNLEVCDQLNNLGSINDMLIEDLLGKNQLEQQIYLTCGSRNNGSLRQLTQGLTVIEMTST